MKIVNKNISDIKPYENNPRINVDSVDKVANSIKEFGYRVPIIIDKNNVIVAGHTRLLAAEKLGITEIPCIVADDLTEQQINAFRLVDNKTTEFSDWDYEKLKEELYALDMDLSEYGFEKISEEFQKNCRQMNITTIILSAPVHVAGLNLTGDEYVEMETT